MKVDKDVHFRFVVFIREGRCLMSEISSSVEIDELVDWIEDADFEACEEAGGYPSHFLLVGGNLVEAYDRGEGEPALRVHSAAKLAAWRAEVDRLKGIHSWDGSEGEGEDDDYDYEDWSDLVRHAEPLDMPFEAE